MRGTTIFILLIPAIIALGHDTYLFYENFLNPGILSIDLIMKEFKFSALGFIWTTYDVESYKMTVENMLEEDWAIIDYLLTFKAFFAGLAFAGLFIVIFLILMLFGIGPFANGEGSVVHGGKGSGFKSKSR